MPKAFLIYNDSLDVLDGLTDEQAGQVFKAIGKFAKGEEVHLNGLLNVVLIPFKQQIQRNVETYNNICERNKLNIQKRWRHTRNTSGINGIPEIPDDTRNTKEKEKEKEKEKDKNKEKEKEKEHKKVKKIFIPPTLEEWKFYFKQNGYKEEVAEKTFRGYEANDWHDSHGNEILAWKQKANFVWFKPENKIPKQFSLED